MLRKVVILVVFWGICGISYAQPQEISAPGFSAKNAQDYYLQGKELIAQGKYRQANEAFKRAEVLLNGLEAKDLGPADAADVLSAGKENTLNAVPAAYPVGADTQVNAPGSGKKNDKKKIIFVGSEPAKKPDSPEDILAKAEKFCVRGLRMDKTRAQKEEIRDYEGAAAAQKEMMGAYAEAIKLYEQVLKIRPRDRNIRYNLGIIYLNRAEYQQAVEAFEKVIELNRRDIDAY